MDIKVRLAIGIVLIQLALFACKGKFQNEDERDTVISRLKTELSKDSLSSLQQNASEDARILKNLNGALQDAKNTEYFIITQYSRDTVPRRLFDLVNLKELTINFTFIKNLPKEICRFTQLEKLDLHSNKLSNIDNIACLVGLRKLRLSNNNELNSLPSNFSNLINLQELHLENCNFNNGLGNRLPPNLTELYIYNDNLSSFPKEILELKKLKSLLLHRNPNLRTLPTEIDQLEGLEILNIEETGVPRSEIEKLKKRIPNCRIHH